MPSGAEVLELQIGTAAHQAALRAVYPERWHAALAEGFVHLCPVRSSVPNACMVGVARLRYRPHTARTGTWIKRLQESAPALLHEFEGLFGKQAA